MIELFINSLACLLQELLLKQGNTELNPLAFLSQETSDDRLLVIIRNKDISGHIHKVPLTVHYRCYFSSVTFFPVS